MSAFGIILGIISIAIGIGTEDITFVFLGIFMFLCGIFIHGIGTTLNFESDKKSTDNESKIFYYKCVENEIYNLDSADKIEKAMSLAKRCRLKFNNSYDIQDMFKKAEKSTRKERYSRLYSVWLSMEKGNIDDTQKKERAISFAKEQGIIINEHELKKTLNKGKKYYDNNIKKSETEAKKKSEDAIEEAKKKQHNKIIGDYDKLIQYSELSGKEKRIAMIKAMMTPFESQLKNINEMEKDRDKMTGYIMNMGIEKEKDWALWGGVAEGLGGLGAGISTALDMQGENAEIRARNERQKSENMNTATSIYSLQNNMIDNARKENMNIQKKLLPYEKMLSRAKSAIVSSKPGTDVIKELDFSNTKVQISPFGAFSVEVDVSQKGNLTIGYDSAVVDGTIAAELYQKGKCVGKALCVLPLKGTENSPVSIKGICKNGANPDLPYEVKFKPYKLCLIEKMS